MQIRPPSASKLRLAAVVAVAGLILGYFLGLWSAVGDWLANLWHFLAASTSVPNWLLGLLAICAIIVAGWLGTALRPTREARPRSPISTQDDFFNIRWRWSYDSSGAVQDLIPYCRRCGHRLVLKDTGADRPAGRYECRCDRCGSVACEIDCPVEEFEHRVLQKIHETTG
ncbi:MAG: hypothetical protein ACOY4R_28545 [Pseudomonadota bacterium]